jgi:hypothetical protein
MIDYDRLAADFSESIRSHLTAAQLAAVNLRNSAETDPHVDHVHDFIDANDCMYDALEKQGLTFTDVDNLDTTWRRARLANYQLRRVLVSCEFSGIVRDRIAAYGHDVISCDILPTENPGKHYVGDVRDILYDGWTDLISFPPCTYLCGSGAKHRVNNPERWAKSMAALDFFDIHDTAPVERKCTENSVGLISTLRRKSDQIIQPYNFGNDASKRTCLWLHKLKKLVADPSQYIAPRIIEYRGKLVKRWANQSPCGADKTAPGPDRWKIRSRTHTGPADAMAAQWFNPLTNYRGNMI